jgi:hypothetical protein
MTEPIDPFVGIVETPKMLPAFSTRHGLRMTYMDAAGRHHCLALSVADLARVLNSGAAALEVSTRERTIPEQMNDIVDRIMQADRVQVQANPRAHLNSEKEGAQSLVAYGAAGED